MSNPGDALKRPTLAEQGWGAMRAVQPPGGTAESNAAVVLKAGYGYGLPAWIPSIAPSIVFVFLSADMLHL